MQTDQIIALAGLASLVSGAGGWAMARQQYWGAMQARLEWLNSANKRLGETVAEQAGRICALKAEAERTRQQRVRASQASAAKRIADAQARKAAAAAATADALKSSNFRPREEVVANVRGKRGGSNPAGGRDPESGGIGPDIPRKTDRRRGPLQPIPNCPVLIPPHDHFQQKGQAHGQGKAQAGRRR